MENARWNPLKNEWLRITRGASFSDLTEHGKFLGTRHHPKHKTVPAGGHAMKLRRIKLTKYERQLEQELLRGEWIPGSKAEFDEIAQMLARRKKDAVLNIRINQGDLDALKARAKRRGIKYQTFIAEILHRVAHS